MSKRLLALGLVGEASMVVSDCHTAAQVGSGQVAVLATPAMIGLMEGASVAATAGCLEVGQVTVGVHVDVQHLAATPVGLQVAARAVLVQIQGRRLTFEVEASDDVELIGRGTHQRVIVDLDRFQSQAAEKRDGLEAYGMGMDTQRQSKGASRDVTSSLKGGLIVSCQAREGWPLRSSMIMAAMAKAAQEGGACGIRANTPEDVAAIRQATSLPLIGLWKQDIPGYEVYITPTIEAARALQKAGADIVAVDATLRPHPDGLSAAQLIVAIKRELDMPVMADISTWEEGVAAAQAGADLVSTTLSGYTPYSPQLEGPDIDLVKALSGAVQVPVIAEGRIGTPEQARAVLEAGAFAVVVGTAITRPEAITARFVKGMKD